MAAISRPDEARDSYLYMRDEWEAIDAEGTSTLGSENSEEPPAAKPKRAEKPEEVVEGGYEIPDFLKGLDDTDIVKIS